MRRVLPTAALFAAVAVAGSPGPAAADCSGPGMAKAGATVDGMVYGPQKGAMTRELAQANEAMSKGDMRGCNRHLRMIERMGGGPKAPARSGM